MAYTYDYPRPSLTVDCVIFGLDASARLKVLLIQRGHDPFEGSWALPGGFVDMNEPLEAAALRELKEETGVENVFIEQLYTFGTPERDPRGRVVTVVYYALINLAEYKISADSDVKDVGWFAIDDLPKLAFDHAEILETAIQRLRGKVRYQPISLRMFIFKNFVLKFRLFRPSFGKPKMVSLRRCNCVNVNKSGSNSKPMG